MGWGDKGLCMDLGGGAEFGGVVLGCWDGMGWGDDTKRRFIH